MKADHATLMKLSELGILRSMPDFLETPLKPGRLRARFLELEFIVDQELRKENKKNPFLFTDNQKELTAYLEKFSKILNVNDLDKKDIHVASVACFCMSFLEKTKTKYPAKLYESLVDIVDYYEREDNVKYSDYMSGRDFYGEWERINQ